VSPHEALQHPTWHMGQKISIDSATMMNKGFEVIEAMHLFGLSLEQIHIIIHPESIIHSMVEFCDGSILAQLSARDMRIPIQHALCYPERVPSGNTSCTFELLQSLTFEQLDPQRYPCVSLAIEAIRQGGTMPAVLNAANDVLVSRFLSGDICFGEIAKGIAYVMVNYEPIVNPGLNDILTAISWAQEFVETY
jgi:1-deoxy-D-xylulose-5-phosphate reductoisomerase